MGSEIIIVPFIFSTFGFIVWVLVTGWQRRQHIRVMTDFNNKLLDRMGSVKDFSEFLQTDGAREFIDRVTAGGTHGRRSAGRFCDRCRPGSLPPPSASA
jgi:hypothetical protein